MITVVDRNSESFDVPVSTYDIPRDGKVDL